MTDNLRRYCDIRDALVRRYPNRLKARTAQHLRTCAHLVSGLVGSRKCHLPAIATKVPDGQQRQSRIKRYERWLRNPKVDAATFYQPYLLEVLSHLPPGPLVLVMDTTPVGRNCIALLISVVYQQRALPRIWKVVRAQKGHLAQAEHVRLVQRLAAWLPTPRPVVFLADGEFNGVGLLQAICDAGWQFVCRVQKNLLVREALVLDGLEAHQERVALSWLNIQPGELIELPDMLFTQADFGPVLLLGYWHPRYDGPLYLVSNLELPEEALHFYRQRFQIETLFSDQKSRGFCVGHSHLSAPERLERLLIAVCLAYVWLVCLGAQVKAQRRVGLIHRRHRCDLSLFQLGLLWVEHCLNEGAPIPVPLRPPRIRADTKCVR
jgi:hypothetical protein